MNVAERIRSLRERLAVDPSAPELDSLYERFLKRDTWTPGEAVCLVVGIDPVSEAAADEANDEPLALLASDLAEQCRIADVDGEDVPVPAVVAWAESAGVELPESFSRLHGFVQQSVLRADSGGPRWASERRSSDAMETLLGAAFNVVANFPTDARNTHGLVDPERVADMIRDKAVVWFGEKPVPYSRDEIVRILDRWLQ